MSLQHIIDELKSLVSRFEGSAAVKAAETEVKALATTAEDYIKANGLQDLYAIALTLVEAMVPGSSWGAVLAAIAGQAKTDGVALLQGAEAVVAAKAQADLLAAGKAAGLATGA